MMKTKKEKRVLVQVLVGPELYKWLEKEAGGVPMSRWLRGVLERKMIRR